MKKVSKKKKADKTTKILIVILIAGLSLLLYPTVSNYWNSFHSTRLIENYEEFVSKMDDKEYTQIMDAATAYNVALKDRKGGYNLNDTEKADYESHLNVLGSGVMGYIEIPSVKVNLPIYHGTDEAVLQVAIGHLEWTSLPIGGTSTHCVLSGHRGLPSAKLFTDIDRLDEGDIFMLHILDSTYTYEVDRILITLPEETEELQIIEGQDYCTLLTCTPYGVNTHRLLVRGHRIDNSADFANVRVSSDALKIEPIIIAPILLVPIFAILITLLVFSDKASRKYSDEEDLLIDE